MDWKRARWGNAESARLGRFKFLLQDDGTQARGAPRKFEFVLSMRPVKYTAPDAETGKLASLDLLEKYLREALALIEQERESEGE